MHESEVINRDFELAKARRTLAAARSLASGAYWDDAISRAYYAVFHAATAALWSAGVQARTHVGVHDLLFQHFVRPGQLSRSAAKDFAALQRYREVADQGVDPQFDDGTGSEELDRATRFVEEIERMLAAAPGAG